MHLPEKIHSNIFLDLAGLKKYPKMYLRGDITYSNMESYLNGYIAALGYFAEQNLHRQISHWFEGEIGEPGALAFTALVEHHYRDRSEEEQIQLLLDTVEAFFRANPRWHL